MAFTNHRQCDRELTLVMMIGVLVAALGCSDAAMASASYDVKLMGRMAAIGSSHGSYAIEPGYYSGHHRVMITNGGDLALPMVTGPKGVAALWVRKAGELNGRIVFEAESAEHLFGDYTTDGDSTVIFSTIKEGKPIGIFRYSFLDDSVKKLTSGPLGAEAWYGIQSLGQRALSARVTFSSVEQVLGLWRDNKWTVLASTQEVDPESPFYFFHTHHVSDDGSVLVRALMSSRYDDGGIYRIAPDGVTTPLVETTQRDPKSTMSALAPWIAANRRGDLVFSAYNKAHGLIWFRLIDSRITPILPEAMPGNADLFPAAINDRGDVVFRFTDQESTSIFVDRLGMLERIAGGGDRVATDIGPGVIGTPHRKVGIFAHSPWINDRGDVAFVSDLSSFTVTHADLAGESFEAGIGIGIFIAHRLLD